MALEIERKFLLCNEDWRDQVTRTRRIRQAYMVDAIGENSRASVRIRIDDEAANINIKSATIGVQRQEYEYPIPLEDAERMIASLCHLPCIEKLRHIVEYQGHRWEIDEFYGDNQGLIVAEIELSALDEIFVRPPWLGREVSDDARYYNVNLLRHPYRRW